MGKGIVGLLSLIMLASCLQESHRQSRVNAMSSEDWFREGVDRVYLAHTETVDGALIKESEPGLKYGQHLTYVVGCYGESENPQKEVDVKPFLNADFTVKMKLHERHKLVHFNLHEDRKEAKERKGCTVLAGAGTQANLITHTPANLEKAPHPNPTGAAVVCSAAAVALAGIVAHVRTGSFATTASGGTTGWLAWVMIMGYLSATASTVYWCGDETGGLSSGYEAFHDQKNKSLFIQEYVKSVEQTLDLIMNNPNFQSTKEQFLQHKANGEIELAVATFNPLFIKNFNQRVNTKFKQGWGGIFASDRFFRAISRIETKKELDEQGFPIDGEFIKHSIHCPDPEQLQTCVADKEENCYEKYCILPDDIVLPSQSEMTETIQNQ